MRIAILCGAAAALLLLAGCTTTKQPVSAAAQAVAFTDKQPGAECRLLGQVTGTQSNWLSGHNEGQSTRGAESDLRNNTVAMGGNVVYGVTTPSENFWSSFAPLDTKMQGQAYHCP
ncbi:DUF4156 domain-containing protein [Affinibrenneria salicis]|uniref:DUF4156 domain-containing protein n=1 Tax=Affinibrenneria salicis TaxID=2590031 RepID=A0A5J5FQQ8_9GAMM|nr:DUF4156 domain-containing protein [Affinibrenneria salicis]KAA8995360.1 DUF4156 domain-containing protein [Affinibrenneria salicis]